MCLLCQYEIFKSHVCISISRSVKLSIAIQDAFSARRRRSQTSNRRVAILCPNGASFLVAQFATWMSGGAAVPLLARGRMTEEQLEHCVQDAECDVVVAAEPQVDRVSKEPILNLCCCF